MVLWAIRLHMDSHEVRGSQRVCLNISFGSYRTLAVVIVTQIW